MYFLKNAGLKICEKHDYNEDQRLLFNETFGVNFTKKKWIEKHYQNPYTGISGNICLYKGDELIGFNMFMPQKYILGKEETVVLQSCESVIAAKERGKGYLKEILLEAEQIYADKFPVIYGLPNSKSKPTFDKLGYKTKFALDKVSCNGRLLNIIKDIFLYYRKSEADYLHSVEDFFNKNKKIKCTRTFFDKQNTYEEKCDIQILRDERLYSWKLNGKGKNYLYLYTMEENNVSAFCVVKFSYNGRLRRCEIIDMYVNENCERDLLLIIENIKQVVSKIDILAVSNSSRTNFLVENGFKTVKKEVCFLLYKVLKVNAAIEGMLETKDNWNFSFIECDTIFN